MASKYWTKADQLLGKLEIPYRIAEKGKESLTKDALAAKLGLNLESIVDRLKFAWVTHRIYHFKDGRGLVFIEAKPGVYTLTIEDPKKAGMDYCGKERPFCSPTQ